jgi:capsular exopolysaccharide synthesis family protein
MTTAGPSSLRDYLQTLRRRKWLVLLIVLAIPAAAVALSLRQEPSYRATAQVLLNSQDLGAALSQGSDTNSSQDPGRYASTQARLARVTVVAQDAIAKAGIPIDPKSLLADSSVTASPDSDLLEFEVNNRRQQAAQRLANTYAAAFVRFRRFLDTRALKRAQDDVAARLRSLSDRGDRRSALYRSLATTEEQLSALQAVQTSHAIVVRTARSATQTQPKPVRNGLLAFVLALILAVGLAFVLQALDTRVGGAVEIADALGLPLLARIPKPHRRLLKNNQLAMLAEPHTAGAEAFRLLRTNLEVVNLDRRARTIMISSAVQEVGKSTTIANLAVAAARAGKRVILVDLDLRRGDVDKFFGALDRSGISEVALGGMDVDDALVPIEINADGTGDPTGSLHILPAGKLPPSAGELVTSARVGDILSELADRADLVLVDAPPFLQVGDAIALGARVDGLVVLTPLEVRRATITEMRRVLDQFRAHPLGVVVTGDASEQTSYGDYAPRRSGGREVHEPVG